MMKKISILIPAYNEQEVLEHLYQRIGKLANDTKSYEFEFLFADDGSRDKTLDIIKNYAKKDKRVKYVSLSRNFGKPLSMSIVVALSLYGPDVSYTARGASPPDKAISRKGTRISANRSPSTYTLREDGNGPVVTLNAATVMGITSMIKG